MNDITRMAREAGLFVPQAGIPENGALTRFAALVAAAEREACVQVCDNIAHQSYGLERGIGASWCAVTIRERSNT